MTKRESGSCSEGFAPWPGDRTDTCPESIERRPAGRPQRDGALGPVAFREEAGGGRQAAAMTGGLRRRGVRCRRSVHAAKRGNTVGGQDVPKGAVRAGATRESGGAEVPCASCRPVVGRAVWEGHRCRIGTTCFTVGGGWPEAGRSSPERIPWLPRPAGCRAEAFFTALTGAIRKPPVCRACGPLRPRCARETAARRHGGRWCATRTVTRATLGTCSVLDRRPRSATSKAQALPPGSARPPRGAARSTPAGPTPEEREGVLWRGTSSRRRNANGVPSGQAPRTRPPLSWSRAMAYAFLRTLVQTRTKRHSAIGVGLLPLRPWRHSRRSSAEDGVPRTFDYTHRTSDHAGGLRPSGPAPPVLGAIPLEWARRVEAADKRKNSRQCRDDVIGPPERARRSRNPLRRDPGVRRTPGGRARHAGALRHPPTRPWREELARARHLRRAPDRSRRRRAVRRETRPYPGRGGPEGQGRERPIEYRGIHHRHRALWTRGLPGARPRTGLDAERGAADPHRSPSVRLRTPAARQRDVRAHGPGDRRHRRDPPPIGRPFASAPSWPTGSTTA